MHQCALNSTAATINWALILDFDFLIGLYKAGQRKLKLMQISCYLLSNPKKAQVSFSWRNIHCLRTKSHKTLGIRFLPRQQLQTEHWYTKGEAGMQVWWDISSSKASCRVTISNPSCTRILRHALIPCLLSLQSPTMLFTAITTVAQKQQLPDFPGIFRTETKMFIYSLTLKQEGISSGTRRGSTVPHARSGTRKEILLQNKKSQNKNRKENNFWRFPTVNCSGI